MRLLLMFIGFIVLSILVPVGLAQAQSAGFQELQQAETLMID